VTTTRRRIPVRGQYRYGAVLVIVLVLVVFQIIAPDRTWTRALDIALAAAALSLAVATSRAGAPVLRRRSRFVGAAGAIFVILIAAGVIGEAITFLVAAVLVAAIPFTLIGGLIRLVKSEGVTIQVVAGALAIYLLVGLVFASVIAFVAHVETGDYFKQGPVGEAVDVYYSFTVLTTTGFGDYTPAHPTGHALAVLEMLSGQLYLVTVIGIVVGNFAGRRMARGEDRAAEQDLEAT
jgi:Ion channel